MRLKILYQKLKLIKSVRITRLNHIKLIVVLLHVGLVKHAVVVLVHLRITNSYGMYCTRTVHYSKYESNVHFVINNHHKSGRVRVRKESTLEPRGTRLMAGPSTLWIFF